MLHLLVNSKIKFRIFHWNALVCTVLPWFCQKLFFFLFICFRGNVEDKKKLFMKVVMFSGLLRFSQNSQYFNYFNFDQTGLSYTYTQTHRHTQTHTHIYMYIYIYTHTYVERERNKSTSHVRSFHQHLDFLFQRIHYTLKML